MKLFFSSLICIAFAGSLFAQEKYPTPKPTTDQKFNRTMYQYWGLSAGAINLAKANGIAPYDYGKSLGKIFVSSWGKPDFDGFVKGMLMNFEYIRRTKDTPPIAQENQDGSVSIVSDDNATHDYFAKGLFNVTYDEFLEYFKGMAEVLASDLCQANLSLVHQDSLLITTIKRK